MLTDAFIPALTYPDRTSPEAIAAAMETAALFATAATVCAIEIDIPDLSRRLGAQIINVEGMAAAAEGRSRAAAAEIIAEAGKPVGALAITTATTCVTLDQVGNAATRLARYHDLSIVAMNEISTDLRALAEALIFGTGRPVLLLPESGKTAQQLAHVAIAWDGSRAAARAMHDAMPLIAKANRVTVVTASREKELGHKNVPDLISYLDRHGIAAEHRDIDPAGKAIGETLQEGALTQGADLLVMGAFGHSRIQEFVLGGATRSTLEALRLPVFLSH